MINVIPSEERYHADHGWLDTRWHFSFSDYYDPDNMNWSALRVFNDDIVQGGGGFDFHPHQDMEIVSYIVDGALEHKDRLGNRHVNRPGEVHFSYERYLLKSLRHAFGFAGSPIRLSFRKAVGPKARRPRARR